MPILDLGCGASKRRGAIGVDIYPLPDVDLVCDLNRTLPFLDNTIDGVYASHVVEHVETFLRFMEDIWRISKPDAWVRIWTPHFSSGVMTWGDPTHRRAFASQTFALLGGGTVHYLPPRFLLKTIRLNLFSDGWCPGKIELRHRLYIRLGKWIERIVNRSRANQLRFERLWCQFFPFSEIYAELVVNKTGSLDPRIHCA